MRDLGTDYAITFRLTSVFLCKPREKQIAYMIKNVLRSWSGYAVANVAVKVARDTPDQLEDDAIFLKDKFSFKFMAKGHK